MRCYTLLPDVSIRILPSPRNLVYIYIVTRSTVGSKLDWRRIPPDFSVKFSPKPNYNNNLATPNGSCVSIRVTQFMFTRHPSRERGRLCSVKKSCPWNISLANQNDAFIPKFRRGFACKPYTVILITKHWTTYALQWAYLFHGCSWPECRWVALSVDNSGRADGG